MFTLIVVIFCAGCVSNLGVYDKSVPPEKLCTLEIPANLHVKKFNGEDVKWAGGIVSVKIIQIPEGTHKLSLGATDFYGIIDCAVKFEAGKTYELYMVPSGQISRATITCREKKPQEKGTP